MTGEELTFLVEECGWDLSAWVVRLKNRCGSDPEAWRSLWTKVEDIDCDGPPWEEWVSHSRTEDWRRVPFSVYAMHVTDLGAPVYGTLLDGTLLPVFGYPRSQFYPTLDAAVTQTREWVTDTMIPEHEGLVKRDSELILSRLAVPPWYVFASHKLDKFVSTLVSEGYFLVNNEAERVIHGQIIYLDLATLREQGEFEIQVGDPGGGAWLEFEVKTWEYAQIREILAAIRRMPHTGTSLPPLPYEIPEQDRTQFQVRDCPHLAGTRWGNSEEPHPRWCHSCLASLITAASRHTS